MSSAAEAAVDRGAEPRPGPAPPDAVTERLPALDRRIREAVKRVAATDPDPTDPFRGLYVSDDLALRLVQSDPGRARDTEARLDDAVRRLGFDALDATLLALCAAPELDPRYGRLLAYLHDDVTRRLVSPRLAGHLLQEPAPGRTAGDVIARFAGDAPLRRTGALRLAPSEEQVPLAERPVRIGERLTAHLLGARLSEAHEGRRRSREVPVPEHDPGRPEVVARLRRLASAATSLPLVVTGPDAVAVLAVALGRGLLVVDVADLDRGEVLADAELGCRLEERTLCFEGLEGLEPAEREAALRGLDARLGRREPVILLLGSGHASTALGDRTTVLVDVPAPTLRERERAWSALAGTHDVTDVAAKFRLSLGQIGEAATVARLAAGTRGDSETRPEDLDLGARRASSSRLGELATQLPPGYTWDDLVVPARQRSLLRSVSAYLRHRERVLHDWGYERSVTRTQGLKVLFAGESGTGKTMAAQVLAADLGLDLYRVDLATVVSKYIGETEKNLDRIFDAAEGSNAILFFDESDALFGKRTEVSDSHDRYANIEVSYLLQRMEGYPGAVVLATNLRRNVDDAFARRLDFVVDFPFPEAEDRRRIWARVLPEPAPVDPEVDLDFLAERFKLSGGAIRNCSVAAAFQAADEGAPIAMRHLVRGVALEYGKLGRLTLAADFERFHGLLAPEEVPS